MKLNGSGSSDLTFETGWWD